MAFVMERILGVPFPADPARLDGTERQRLDDAGFYGGAEDTSGWTCAPDGELSWHEPGGRAVMQAGRPTFVPSVSAQRRERARVAAARAEEATARALLAAEAATTTCMTPPPRLWGMAV